MILVLAVLLAIFVLPSPWGLIAVVGAGVFEVGQTFGMAMYHPNHPDGSYRMVNQVRVFDPPNAIAWAPGYIAEDGDLAFGGWTWRYDLETVGPSRTNVTLTYDWSAVPDSIREHLAFPPFAPDHLDNSLAHLAALATS